MLIHWLSLLQRRLQSHTHTHTSQSEIAAAEFPEMGQSACTA